ncbi:energy-coupling factor transporter ATPase [Clostridium sp. cel8]|jgi:energy-coupling factor transport system ATP-binding protein|uniref:energy-coupling factor transporter ATPase n=1 Tax=unclassified Clostridium TaxID=2614128 RepID=UPI0015F696D6|nr:energy-coupling factor transporter ATPase [Clostridium sp. cel8]MBA5851735.1 energy-coupling factor transporter ATPase [Clostridium sp. cel8]
MKEKMIDCKNLSFSYDDSDKKNSKLVVDDVTFKIDKGDFIAILGRNGSGKSTLAKHMNALLIPTEGKMYVGDLDTSDKKNTWNIRNRAGMVFQNPDNQIVATIVEEDVAFGPENLGIDPKDIRARVNDCLKSVNMYEYRKHAPHLLSGGQKQRVAIAGVLAMRPECIIFDESTAMLDPSGRKEVMNTIKEINHKYKITVILITHYMDEAAQADKIIVIDKGKVSMQGTPRDIFSHVQKMKNLGLDVPQITELAYELKKSGINIQSNILTIDEMVKELCRLK